MSATYLRHVISQRSGSGSLDEVLLDVESLRRGVEDPLELDVLGRVCDDVTAHLDPLALGNAVHLHLTRLAEGLVWK